MDAAAWPKRGWKREAPVAIDAAAKIASSGAFLNGGCRLLRHLSADFAALVRFGVDIDVPFAGQEVGGLRVGERGGALERARVRSDRQRDTAILARLPRVEMGGGGGSGEA